MATQVPLTRGFFATVDDEDVPLVSGHRWSYADRPTGPSYAITSIYVGKKRTTIAMHRLLMNAPRGIEVDHIDFDGLNNRRNNLRLATRSQNEQNHPEQSNSKTGIRGVYCNPSRRKPYSVVLYLQRKPLYFGNYATLDEARQVAREARRIHYTHAPVCREEAKP